MDSPKGNFEQETLAGLVEVKRLFTHMSTGVGHAQVACGTLTRKLDAYETTRAIVADRLASARLVLREQVLKKLDVELAFRREYVEKTINASGLTDRLNFSNDDISLSVVKPLTVVIKKDRAAPCDIFGPDQIGIRAKTRLSIGRDQSTPTLHFGLGAAFGKPPTGFFLASAPHLHGATNIDPTVIDFLETAIAERLDHELAAMRMPMLESGEMTSAHRAVEYLAASVNDHIGLQGRLIATNGSIGPVDPHPAIDPIVRMNSWEDVVMLCTPHVFLELMKIKFIQLARDRRLDADRASSRVITDPTDMNPNPAARRKVFMVETSVFCINEFDDREDYGRHQLYASFEVRQTPGEKELYLKTRLTGYFSQFIPASDLPEFSVLKVRDNDRLEASLTDESMRIGVGFSA